MVQQRKPCMDIPGMLENVLSLWQRLPHRNKNLLHRTCSIEGRSYFELRGWPVLIPQPSGHLPRGKALSDWLYLCQRERIGEKDVWVVCHIVKGTISCQSAHYQKYPLGGQGTEGLIPKNIVTSRGITSLDLPPLILQVRKLQRG